MTVAAFFSNAVLLIRKDCDIWQLNKKQKKIKKNLKESSTLRKKSPVLKSHGGYEIKSARLFMR